jgi:hypothetical protein
MVVMGKTEKCKFRDMGKFKKQAMSFNVLISYYLGIKTQL